MNSNNNNGNNNNNNKSMPQSPVSVASAVSSDTTSETQSVSDEQLAVSTSAGMNRSASKSGRKLSKESTKETIEKERPPWRTVIAATPPKVNKNALLKAKILDATRRALLAQKICHIGIQTEPSTTLLREQSIDVQKDLIRKMDKSMDTDGVVTIRRECPRGFIITHTVGQMTERPLGLEIGTQTPLPKTSLNFDLLRPMNGTANDNSAVAFAEQMKRNETILRDQIDALRKFEATKLGKKSLDAADEQCDSIEDGQSKPISPNVRLDGHTLTCWDDFDLSDDDNDLPDLPRKTISDGSTPWNDFTEQIIGRRLAAMHLSPVPRRVPTKNSKGKSVTWNDNQLVVTRLLTETSALIDIFDQMAMRLGPNVELKNPKEPHIEPIVIPESKWNAMLADSCNLLEEKLMNFRPHEHKSRLEITDA